MGCTRILFVCAGNICRSPLAEGILKDIAEKAGRLDEFDVDSAGTGGWHQGSPPDRRSVAVATRHGIDISGQRARRVTDRDFASFDLILAMDKDNPEYLRSRSPASSLGKIHLFDAYTRSGTRDVPDPYYGGSEGFESVYAMLFAGCSVLVAGSGKTRGS
ncbi:low molecular weight protein-tyrosine-phosphatase [Rhizobium sp. RAF56]|uniref:low molecular weight protein-tyrosine-phosphatase n=1 Tax=Rhizobium sp. RAF56 TaxID=3233062 RepID=UPI003F975E15